jgi:hypothetical protein
MMLQLLNGLMSSSNEIRKESEQLFTNVLESYNNSSQTSPFDSLLSILCDSSIDIVYRSFAGV